MDAWLTWLSRSIKWLNDNSGAVIAVATVVYTVATIALWKATKRQATATREQAELTRQQAALAAQQIELTREIFDATHRPEISVRPYIDKSAPANPGFVLLGFELHNHGQMAAIVTEWAAALMREDNALGSAEGLRGQLCVFPDAKEDMPAIEVKGSRAASLWPAGNAAAVYLHAKVGYRGTSGSKNYMTAIHGRFVVTDPMTFNLDRVEHEVS